MIIDNRERNLEIIDSLANNNVKLSFTTLPVGDYIISDRIGVERKTAQDFERSIIDSRLFEQAKRLQEGYTRPMLIIEGGFDYSSLSKNVILGAIMALYVDHNIQVILTEDATETSYVLSKVAEREQSTEHREPRISGNKRAFTLYQWQLAILSTLPGVGNSLAKNLLSHFKTLRNISNATTEELMEVNKIGKKKASRIYQLLNSEIETAANSV